MSKIHSPIDDSILQNIGLIQQPSGTVHHGYNIDTTLSYLFYDTKFDSLLLDKLNMHVPRDEAYEFDNDYDITNYLYSVELNNLFGLDETDDTLESEKYMRLFDVMDASPLSGCMDLLATQKTVTPILMMAGASSILDNRRTVLPILFSYDLLFFTHICLCDFFRDGVIKPLHIEALCHAIREYV